MSANDRQIGGGHYQQGGEQHWDRIWRIYGRGYFVGCATKYIERYHLKNGIQDLEKAIHFLEKLIELEKASKEMTLENCKEFKPWPSYPTVVTTDDPFAPPYKVTCESAGEPDKRYTNQG